MARNTAIGISGKSAWPAARKGTATASVAQLPSLQRSRAGFTIIELLIVMTLVIILASIGMTQYRSSVTRAEEAALKENLFRMRDAMDQYYAD